MGNKKTSLLLAGLAAGAYAYLRKPENREKALEAFNSTKVKVNDFVEVQKQNIQKTINDKKATAEATETAESSSEATSVTGNAEKDYHLDEKDMVSEGALTSVQYYNEEAQERLDTKERNYFIDDKNMVSEGSLTKVQYENDTEQQK